MDIIVPDNTDTDTIIPYIYYRILSFQIQILPLQIIQTLAFQKIQSRILSFQIIQSQIRRFHIHTLTDIIIPDYRDITIADRHYLPR